MTKESQSDEGRSSAKSGMIERATKRLSAVMLVVGLAACSTAPEWARPGLIYGDDAEAAAADPNTEKDFPELADVPGQVPARSSDAELRSAAEGLAADRERARYSDEVLRGGTGTPAPAPRSAAPAPAPAALPTASAPVSAPTTASAANEAGVIPLPARGGRSSLAPAASEAAAAVSEPVTRAAATAEVSVQPSPAPQASTPAPAPQPVAAATPVAPTPAPVAQTTPRATETSRRPAVPAVPDTGRVASTSQPSSSTSSATPNYRERPPVPPVPVVTSEPAARTEVAPTPRLAPSVAAAAPVQRSNTSFEASSAPALTQDALEAAGPVVSSRYGASGAPTGSADPEDPVEVNLDALRGLGPGASLAPSQTAPNGAAYANQGGPGNIPPYVVSFAHGSAGLNAEDRQKIAAAAASAAQYRGLVRVVGHASSRTGDLGVGEHLLANFGVSLDRATVVANELIRAGVDASRVVVEAKGDSVPVYYESMPAGEAGNRRAEIFIE
jgi:flagellar motor protein MotB